MLDAIDNVREAYDKYQDDSSCYTLEITSHAGIELTGGQPIDLMTCQLMANTTAMNLSTVGSPLRNAAK